MNQLTQNLKSGKMDILEVPHPSSGKGIIMVRNHYSLISAGTEGSKVETARKGYIGKAKEKPEAVKQVLDSIKSDGIMATYHKVMNKLDSPSPLGYSCAGEIIAISDDVIDFKIGDFVACGGATAAHAEVVAVPKNLCVKIPEGVKIEHAAYTTVASIALQGIRQADLRLGENCVVIGLGLIGQLTVQMLKASGIKVVGIDIDNKAVELAKISGADLSFERSNPALESAIADLTGGFGTDAVIITAGTSSLDPVELSGKLCRKRGKVIIVGAVPTGFSRETYFKKELSLLMSSSYGPGRYDNNYEEKGLEYPIGYVRWTENRNMQAYLDLLASGKLNIDILTSHVFDFENAISAYDMIVEKSEPYVGILLKYDISKALKGIVVTENKTPASTGSLKMGFIGAGSFAQKFLLPNAKKMGTIVGVSTAQGNDTRNIADKYDIKKSTGNYLEITNDPDINTVFIATPHNLHAQQVLASLKGNKNVFVEKPLCLHKSELEEIKAEYEKRKQHLMVGYNRRFSPHTLKILSILGKDTKKSINYRINCGNIPADSWIQDKEIGGGRILGEVCHFIDLAMFLANSDIEYVSAFVMSDPGNLMDTLNVNISFKNGSIATISYFANGSKNLNKEYLEVYSNGVTAICDDFRETIIYGKGKSKFSPSGQDKGHAAEVMEFLKAVAKGNPTPISFKDIYMSQAATFAVIESIRTRQIIQI